MRDIKARRQIFFINRKAVVLTGYHNLLRFKILNRVVCTVVAKLHFDRLRTAGN